MRTSKFVVFVRSCFVIFCIYLPISWMWNAMTQTNYWKPSEIAIAAVLSVLLYGGFAWFVTNLGMGLMFGRKPEYRAYKNGGGDPFFDTLPRVFNPDSQTVRTTGQDEPRSNQTVPSHWQFRCPQCNARVQHRIDVCWNCNYGADSDNTAYLQRYGNVKPPEFTDEQWQRVLNGQAVNDQSCSDGSCSSPDDGYDGWIPVDERPN